MPKQKKDSKIKKNSQQSAKNKPIKKRQKKYNSQQVFQQDQFLDDICMDDQQMDDIQIDRQEQEQLSEDVEQSQPEVSDCQKSQKTKQKKNKKKSKKETNLHVGRPPRLENEVLDKIDKTIGFYQRYNCLAAFMDYFTAIGQEKGLVFKQQQRKELKKNQQFWNPSHKWYPQQQRGKLQRTMEKLKEIQDLRKYELPDKSRAQQIVYKFILDISGIFCNEVTQEIYNLIKQIIGIVLQNAKMKELYDLQKMRAELWLLGTNIFSEERGKTDFKYLTFQFCKLKQLQIKVAQQQKIKASSKLVMTLGQQFFLLFRSINFLTQLSPETEKVENIQNMQNDDNEGQNEFFEEFDI